VTAPTPVPKVKLDEHLPYGLAALLRARDIDADTVADEGLSGATDPEVLAAAHGEGRMVLTLDRGFGDIRAYPPGTHPGIGRVPTRRPVRSGGDHRGPDNLLNPMI
jgi:predicted nuclease of predicted toxin-antitoxin system